MKSTTKYVKLLVVAASFLVLANQSALAQGKVRTPATELALKVYRVNELVISPPDYPYKGWDDVSANKRSRGGGLGGGGGASFFGSGGSFIAGGGGSATQGIGSGGPSANQSASLQSSTFRFGIDDLRATIVATVAPETWDQKGGQGVCTLLGGSLVIKQTARAHEQIEALLQAIRLKNTANQMVTIKALWLSLSPKQLHGLTVDYGDEGPPSVGVHRDVLATLAPQVPSYRGQITCFNGQTVHVTAGEQRTVSVGAVPTVGVGAVGYTLVTARPNIGAVIQVLPIISTDGNEAILDLRSSLTGWNEPGEPVRVSSHFLPARSKGGFGGEATEIGDGPIGTTNAEIDRLNMSAQEMATTVRLPFGAPVLVGGMSSSDAHNAKPNADGHQPWHWYLIVEVTIDKWSGRGE